MAGRPRRVPIAFLALWIVVWTSAIFIAIWSMGATALDGEPAAAIFLVVWIAAAGFGLAQAVRSLVRTATGEKRERHGMGERHQWNDGFDTTPPSTGANGAIASSREIPGEADDGRRRD